MLLNILIVDIIIFLLVSSWDSYFMHWITCPDGVVEILSKAHWCGLVIVACFFHIIGLDAYYLFYLQLESVIWLNIVKSPSLVQQL